MTSLAYSNVQKDMLAENYKRFIIERTNLTEGNENVNTSPVPELPMLNWKPLIFKSRTLITEAETKTKRNTIQSV